MNIETNIECNNTTIDQEVQFLIEQFCVECRSRFECNFSQIETEISTFILAISTEDPNKTLSELSIHFDKNSNKILKIFYHDSNYLQWVILLEGNRDNRSFNQYKTLK